jgi:hypothetical protein
MELCHQTSLAPDIVEWVWMIPLFIYAYFNRPGAVQPF